MIYKIDHQHEDALYHQSSVWAFKMAIGALSGLLLAAAILVSFSFSLLTTGVLVVFAVIAAWISTKLRD